MNDDLRIVVTGIGPLSSVGFGKEQLWRSITEGNIHLEKEEYFVNGEMLESYYLHKILNFDIDKFDIDKNILKDIMYWRGQESAIDLFYLMVGVKLALDDSGIGCVQDSDSRRVGLVLTHENPGMDQFYEDMINESYDLSRQYKTKEEYFKAMCDRFMKRGYELQTFMFLFHVAKVFNVKGYSLFLNNACASGLYAFEAASDIIKSGKCDKVVIAAADCGSIFKYLWFKEIGMYHPDGEIKPFAKGRNGFVTGDGGAGMVLESFKSAVQRDARIYAEYAGGGFSMEGWKVAVPNMISDSYKSAIMDAITNSNIKKEEIDLLVPHGVGTSVSDAYEAKAITDIFGAYTSKPLITAFKPYIGHNLGGSALLETAILLMALDNDLIPPTLNCDEVDPKLKIEIVKRLTNVHLEVVMKTACGFAGYNAACIFRKIGSHSI